MELRHVPENERAGSCKPRVAVFTTGGTIASRFDPAKRTITPALTGKELLSLMPDFDAFDIELHEFCNMPSPYLTPDIGLRLAGKVEESLRDDEIDGAVVVQGTDTLEEIAYLFHLVLSTPKPVVFTGAMKSENQLYTDGTGNLVGAIRLAASGDARERGIMVYFNQYIHSARHVVKVHTNTTDSFRSPECGPIGTVYDDYITFYTKPDRERCFQPKHLSERVELIKATCGMDDLLIKASINAGVSGIIIEGLGMGNLPPNVVGSVARAIEKQIPVVLVSRCLSGHSMNVYAYEGGAANLSEIGVIMGGNLTGQKARIKLMVLLSCSKDLAFVRGSFEG